MDAAPETAPAPEPLAANDQICALKSSVVSAKAIVGITSLLTISALTVTSPAREPTVVDVPSIAAATVETISLVAKAIPTAAAPAPEPPPERFTINGLVFASKSTSDCAETVALSFILAVTELRI